MGRLSENDTTDVYDSSLAIAAKKNFRARTQFDANDAIGKTFIKQLNVLPAKRIEQILVNLDRLRWMPQINDSASIIVNI